MAYVQIDASGAINGTFGGPQPGNDSCIEVDDADPRLVAFLVPRKPTQLNPGDFLSRFTPAEQALVVAAAAQQTPLGVQIQLGLTMGLARGYIDFNGRCCCRGCRGSSRRAASLRLGWPSS